MATDRTELLKTLMSQRILILDGAMGTMIQRRKLEEADYRGQRFADWPTRRSPPSAKATMDGVVRVPSEFSMTFASDPSIRAIQEFVVPKSIPITLLILSSQFSNRTSRPE